MGVSLPESGTLRLPSRVHFGYGSRAQLPEVVRTYGRRALLVVDPFLTRTPFLAEAVDGLTAAGVSVRVHADVTPELPVSSLDAAGAVATEFAADVVVAIGGGSALDAAKLIALLAVYGGPLSSFYGENLVPGPVAPIVALPTTAGTGSEVTPVAVVSDPERELKVGISSPFLVPAAAIVDPEFTLGSPATVTAYSGIDALVHAVESYTARELSSSWDAPLPVFTGRNVLSGPVALQAARHLGPWLEVAVASPGDRRAREEVAAGALLGGVAFGSTGTHLCHALQYPIGALTKTPHGLGTGLMLPYVLDAISADPATADRIATLGAVMHGIAPEADGPAAVGSPAVGGSGLGFTAAGTIARVAAINRAIGVPRTLADIGLGRDELPRIAELALGSARLLAIAPIEPSRDVLLEILTRAHDGLLTDRSAA
ncbi:iron-containing alcohol dehydrogenase [Cryptosporangium phraense]|uniref:Iron-containing alcohol dehydrogenase n=1 Tax=Cryptosporangium phraense TaxID=2593070 RepID=A0A545ANY4_9ACTN|nr:iron-containing alcohol dehydrogenase [Cryptosporangium phraense]TQS43044.1 iron-containing alcohol dehydrogenase [Cryptosporangium phraense]